MIARASQAALAMKFARGQVGQAGALEFGDALLDHRVPAVVGLDLEHVAVGDEHVVVPGGE